jgi:peptidoglycan hydrolase-like protein with peptidoglycan-binding domain
MLKTKGLYRGDANGKLDPATRDAIKSFQQDNGLRSTGTLNRATLEKMGIELTEKQKAIPASASSYASAKSSGSAKRGPVFRATKEQIAEAQKLLKSGGMYSGDETGKLDDSTRDGLKKYQEAKGLKVTGTLNQATLEKMGISLTDKQKSVDETR